MRCAGSKAGGYCWGRRRATLQRFNVRAFRKLGARWRSVCVGGGILWTQSKKRNSTREAALPKNGAGAALGTSLSTTMTAVIVTSTGHDQKSEVKPNRT